MEIFKNNHLTKNKLSGIVLILIGIFLITFFEYIKTPSEFLNESPSKEISFDGFLRFIVNFPFSSVDFGLFIINIGLYIIIFSKEFHEDERIEMIRNYCFKAAFRQSIVIFIIIGLIVITANLLVCVLAIQIYYYFLFRLCSYRDSALVYATEGDLKDFVNKNKKTYMIMIYSQAAISGVLGGLVTVYKPESWEFPVVLIGCIVGTIWTVGIHWKSESLK